MTQERILALEGGRNIRDMGGYHAGDGLITRWRTLYRSGALCGLTETDKRTLDQVGVKAVFDLRTEHERRTEPHSWPRSGDIAVYCRDYLASGGELARLLDDPRITGESARRAMVENYRVLPFEQADAYRVLYSRMATGEVPAIFNCTAGKDRTGVAAAILLRLLGVSEDEVFEDYCLTNKHLSLAKLQTNISHASDALVEMSVLDALIDAHPDYLSACFSEIEERCGGVEEYACDVLGLESDVLRLLRRSLLVAP